jgi:myo-inositol 2-dehydrogenase/D-chiro-inositol 1-dehydrogenase
VVRLLVLLQAALVAEDPDPRAARRHRTGAVSRYHAGKVVDDGLHPGWFERVKPTYAAALAHFVTTPEHGDAITPSPDDGLKAQAIAEAAARSLTTGKSETITY